MACSPAWQLAVPKPFLLPVDARVVTSVEVTRRVWNPCNCPASIPSSLSALRLATLAPELTFIGALPASTVCREVNRNGGRRRYRAQKAEEQTSKRARRPKRCWLAINERLRVVVAGKLRKDWSPEQISGWLKREYPDDEAMRISHETIYRTLFVQARGALKRELLAHLRSGRMMRKGRHASTRGQPRGQIKEAVSIRERPPEAEDRAVPGHWEGDLLSGSRDTHVATLVERSSRFLMLVRVGGKDTESVVAALGAQIRRLPRTMMATLTWDRGTEMAAHKKFTVATDVSVYFCDPKSPWQRGTSENTNRLLRQYLPRKTDLSVYDQTDLDLIALKLNTRPRKTLYRSALLMA